MGEEDEDPELEEEPEDQWDCRLAKPKPHPDCIFERINLANALLLDD